MRTVTITEVRQDATSLVEEVQASKEPILVIQRSRPTAYLVGASAFEEMQAELRRLRHELFWQGVEEAADEYRRGQVPVYDDVEKLVSDLGLDA